MSHSSGTGQRSSPAAPQPHTVRHQSLFFQVQANTFVFLLKVDIETKLQRGGHPSWTISIHPGLAYLLQEQGNPSASLQEMTLQAHSILAENAHLYKVDVENAQIVGDEFEIDDVRERPDQVAQKQSANVSSAKGLQQLVRLPLQCLGGEEKGHQEDRCHQELVKRHLGQHCSRADQRRHIRSAPSCITNHKISAYQYTHNR